MPRKMSATLRHTACASSRPKVSPFACRLTIERRIAIWERLATDLRPPHLDEAIAHEIPLEEAPAALDKIVRGEIQGRTVVRVAG